MKHFVVIALVAVVLLAGFGMSLAMTDTADETPSIGLHDFQTYESGFCDKDVCPAQCEDGQPGC